MKEIILSLLFLAFALSGNAFAENRDPSISQTSAPAGGQVMTPTRKSIPSGVQDPDPAIWEPGRTDANYGGGESDSPSYSSDDSSSYSSGD